MGDVLGGLCMLILVFGLTAFNWDVEVKPYVWKYAEQVCSTNDGISRIQADWGGSVTIHCLNKTKRELKTDEILKGEDKSE